MAVRNCAEIGENLQKIIKRLMANDNLVNLLYYTDKDPLSQQALSDEQKQKEIFNKLIKITPRLDPTETAHSVLSVTVTNGAKLQNNGEFRVVTINIEIYVPMTQWLIKGTNLRPFAIMGEIQKSLDGKTINGLGKMEGGNFNLHFNSDEMTCYHQNYVITTYD